MGNKILHCLETCFVYHEHRERLSSFQTKASGNLVGEYDVR